MNWNDLDINGKLLPMDHLRPFWVAYDIAGEQVSVRFEFGFHCFTDEKGNGPELTNGRERRYFCSDRYHCSIQISEYIQKRFFEGYVVPHMAGNNQRFFCLDSHEYAIFFTIQKPKDTENQLKIRIISAYTVDDWGRSALPRGNAKRVRYVLEMKNQGKKI